MRIFLSILSGVGYFGLMTIPMFKQSSIDMLKLALESSPKSFEQKIYIFVFSLVTIILALLSWNIGILTNNALKCLKDAESNDE